MDKRRHLLLGVQAFVRDASRLVVTEWIALGGSLTTDKANPKDADVMVGLKPGLDLKALAILGRRLKGHGQHINSGADIFLFENNRYIGRTCGYRDPWTRVACQHNHCSSGRPYLCDTSQNVRLKDGLENHRHILLWPEWKAEIEVPKDVREILSPKY
jgi:hypothetical protein